MKRAKTLLLLFACRDGQVDEEVIWASFGTGPGSRECAGGWSSLGLEIGF